jgi:threonine dehydrogenase-like Zn-dependent dehydrogenase
MSEPSESPDAMRAARVLEPGRIEIESVPLPIPKANEVRIRLAGTGVCASNLPPWEGREWFTYPLETGGLGHEGWGVVDAVGADVSRLRIGDPVAALSQHAYAEYDVADADDVIRLPDALAGKPFPGEPLGCAMNIFRRAEVQHGQTVAIVGIGFLGALLIQLAVSAGARVIAIAHRSFAQQIAHEMGAHLVIPMDDHYRIIEQVKELTEGAFCPVVIECTGKQWPLDLSAELCAIRGRLVIAGYHQDGLRQVNLQLWNWRGLDVIPTSGIRKSIVTGYVRPSRRSNRAH